MSGEVSDEFIIVEGEVTNGIVSLCRRMDRCIFAVRESNQVNAIFLKFKTTIKVQLRKKSKQSDLEVKIKTNGFLLGYLPASFVSLVRNRRLQFGHPRMK